jgi:serine/threonine-protein phosphatase 4 regulatory subunit 1
MEFLNFRQLILILELYNPSDVHTYLMHIALKLCADKVSRVRWISFKLVRQLGLFCL